MTSENRTNIDLKIDICFVQFLDYVTQICDFSVNIENIKKKLTDRKINNPFEIFAMVLRGQGRACT